MSSSLRSVEPAPEAGARAVGRRRWQAPLLVLAGAFGLAALLFATRPSVVVEPPEVLPPLVRTVRAELAPLRLDVRAEGSVEAQVRSELVAEVAGRVVALAPALVAGGSFARGDVLLRLDDREYRVALEKAEASVERLESELRLADRQLERRRALLEQGVASVADLDAEESRADVARASLRSARADLARAQLDLERTALRAPYAGRVSERRVDRGQFVTTGASLASLYSTEGAEIRLPVPDSELSHLGLPLDFEARGGTPGPPVTLEAQVAGERAQWRGAIDRIEGRIDPRTRMATLVARVADPFGRERDADARPTAPLAPGLFVSAVIEGRALEAALRLPSVALREGDRVFVVEEGRLRTREVSVLRRERDTVVIAGGIEAGELVCVSPLEAATDGMQVRTP